MGKDFFDDLVGKVEGAKKNQYIHTPYRLAHDREPDLEVEYILDKAPELENAKPAQGMRCNFLYAGDDLLKDGAYSFAPELLDDNGDVITDKRIPMAKSGRAFMWMGADKNRQAVHQKRMKVGVLGSWVVGPYKLADVKVTRILGLLKSEGAV